MFLFDTDILSQLLKSSPSVSLVRRLAAVPPEQQFTSTITVGEMIYGAYRSGRSEYFLQRLEERVWPNVRILAFDQISARTYGWLRTEMENMGRPISEPDTRIAAIALTYVLTLVTGNVKHFFRVPGLQVENWLQA